MTILPCSDGFATNHQEVVEHCNQSTSPHSHDHDSEDDCSPFCNCECCGSVIAIPQVSSCDDVEPKSNSSYVPYYSINYNFDFLKGIWHPPSIIVNNLNSKFV